MRGAKLAGKNLAYANAGRAFLVHADFYDSWLNRANLRKATFAVRTSPGRTFSIGTARTIFVSQNTWAIPSHYSSAPTWN